jgi:hypothetical protein
MMDDMALTPGPMLTPGPLRLPATPAQTPHNDDDDMMDFDEDNAEDVDANAALRGKRSPASLGNMSPSTPGAAVSSTTTTPTTTTAAAASAAALVHPTNDTRTVPVLQSNSA